VDLAKNARKLFMLCWFAYMISYIGRYDFSACMSEMVAEGIFTKTFGGTIGMAFFAAYGIGQLINGLLGDRISPKYMIFTGLLGSALMNIAIGFSYGRVLILVLWCLNGYFCSMLWAPIVHCFSDLMLKKQQIKAGTNISASIPVGNILSYLISSVFLKYMSWRMSFIVSGLMVLCYAFTWSIGMSSLKGYIEAVRVKRQEEIMREKVSGSSPAVKTPLIPLLLGTGLVFAILGILFNGILKDGVTLWVPTYISDFFGSDGSVASLAAVILPLFNLLGAYMAAYVYKKVRENEMLTAGIMFALSTCSLLLLFFFGKYSMLLAVVFIAMTTAAMLGANNMFLTFIPLNFCKVGRASSVTGFLDACSYLASALSGVTIGVIADNYGWNTTVLVWAAVAVSGAVISLMGVSYWKKGKEKLNTM
jgi:OPA family glycerol-3-phosphate transporter-like MFS transporter